MATWRALAAGARAEGIPAHEVAVLVDEHSGRTRRARLAEVDLEASDAAEKAFRAAVAERLAGRPLQHVIGHWSFRTIELECDARALVPRPETELVVEHALEECRRIRRARGTGALLVADLGTGTGAIALSIAAEEPAARVLAIDASCDALRLCATNRARLDRSVRERCALLASDWWSAVAPAVRFDCVVANPPYLAADEWPGLDPVVRDYDPYDALVAGPTGIEDLVALVESAPGRLADDGALVLEHAPHQGESITARAHALGLRAAVHPDLAGRPRVTVVRR